MHNKFNILVLAFVATLFCACGNKKQEPVVTPWGQVIGDSTVARSSFSIDDIINNGEMIILTMSGPETYFDYHGKGMGTQYLLCEKFAQQIGVSLRVELCKDTTEMINRLKNGEADMIVLSSFHNIQRDRQLLSCVEQQKGVGWIVSESNKPLAEAVRKWFKPDMVANVRKEEQWMFSARSVSRHVYAPFLDRSSGVISKYDNLFRRYAPMARIDWKLLAAQCYQESCFDTNARSWAGAQGLMQIMPATADHLGFDRSELNDPEKNIEASVRYHAELMSKFRDVRSADERQNFVLASYNGGFFHIRDAMALTRKYGGNPHLWAHVAPFVLRLQQPKYYSDPVVKYGYMRGSETVDYVERIRQRYAQYRGVKYIPRKYEGSADEPAFNDVQPTGLMTPKRATKKYKYHI